MPIGPKSYSQFTARPRPLDGAEILGVTQDGNTYRTTTQEIADLAGGSIDGARLADLETARMLGRVFYPEGFDRSTGAVVALNSGLGAVVGGTIDCLVSFNAARDAAIAAGGGFVECQDGVYGLSNDFTIQTSGVRLIGSFSMGLYWTGTAVGTVLKRIGTTVGDAVVRVITPTGSSNSLVGNSVENIAIDGGGIAKSCIHTQSVQHGAYRNLFLRGGVSYLGKFDSASFAGGGQVSVNQGNILEDIIGTCDDVKSADGLIFDGCQPFVTGQGNFSINHINRVSIRHSDGVAFKILSADSNVFTNLAAPRSGSGTLTGFSTTPGTDSLFHKTAHGFVENDVVTPGGFTATGGITNGTKYYVIATGLTANAFAVSATLGGAAVTLSGGGDSAGTFSRAGRGIGIELNASMVLNVGHARTCIFNHYDAGPGGIVARGTVPVTNATANGTTTVTSSDFATTMVGRAITGPGVPAGTVVSSVTAGVSAVLSNAVTTGTGLTLRVDAIQPSVNCHFYPLSYENTGNGPTYGLGLTDVITVEAGARLFYTENTGNAAFKSLILGPAGSGDLYPTITPVVGNPQSQIFALPGSLAMRVDAGTSPRGAAHVKGGTGYSNTGWKPLSVETISSVSGNITAVEATTIVDANTGDRTVTMPTATNIGGRPFRIKKSDPSTHTVTILPAAGGETIEGAASYVLREQGESVVLISNDAANWIVVSAYRASDVLDRQIVFVTGSDATNATATLADITGLVIPLGVGSYDFRAKLKVATSADTNGNRYGPGFTGTLGTGGSTMFAKGSASTTGVSQGAINGINVAMSAVFLPVASIDGLIVIEGFIAVATAGNFSLQHMHPVAGTSTVRVGSFLEARKVNT